MISTEQRCRKYSFVVESELRDAANEHGYRLDKGQAAGWLFFSSASAPGEIAVAATDAGLDGPLFLSVSHPGAARELTAEPAQPCAKGHAAAFVFADRERLYAGVKDTYRLSLTLPTLPYEKFVKDTAHLGDTEAEQLQKIRIGQELFRSALLGYWNGRCPLMGITDLSLLRASHIIPWARCESDQERLNVHNGLLLSSLWDAAFDSGLLTFGPDGLPWASDRLTLSARTALMIDSAQPLVLVGEQLDRLAWHRANVWLGS